MHLLERLQAQTIESTLFGLYPVYLLLTLQILTYCLSLEKPLCIINGTNDYKTTRDFLTTPFSKTLMG